LLVRPTIAWLAGVDIPFALVATTQLILPATLAYAILRHDLYGIDVQVRRALAATASYTAIAGLFLFLTLITANQVTQRVPAFARGLTFLTIVLAAITFRPLHQRLQQLIERRIYPEYAQFRRGVAEVEQALLTVRSPAELKTLFTETLPARLGASGATWLPADTVAATPEAGWQGSVRLNDQLLAHYWLAERESGVPYSSAEQHRLGQLLDRLALALAYAEAAAALQTLNLNLEATVSERTEQLLQQQRSLAVAEERQRLARDLHDSVTQTLFSMGLSIRALARQVPIDPDAAVRGLGEQEQAAHGALAEMRALLTQLRAPLLAEGDLVNALRVQATLLEQQTGFRVNIIAPESLVLPPDVAQELLYVAREALHNAAKHSGVDEARCELVLFSADLTMRIIDEGCGLEAAGAQPAGPIVSGGLGLQTMRERVQALRGELAIHSNNDGTCIQVTIPRHWRES
ncbi:MAG: sensor histidine kinase, partial [Anaerolineales bacterium]|nr:sensor histidine kinase [Anaerolineales bacterium]